MNAVGTGNPTDSDIGMVEQREMSFVFKRLLMFFGQHETCTM